MANEIQLAYGTTGRTLYAVIRTAVGTVWNGAAFEAFAGANWTTYDVPMTEQGTSGYYAGDFPSVAAGAYDVEVRDRAGGSPAVTDPLAGSGGIDWDGTGVRGAGNANVEAIHATDLTGTGVVSDPWGPA